MDMRDQNEIFEVDDPAVEVLTEHLGWNELGAKDVNGMRDSLKQPILVPIFIDAIKKMNPWISEENVQKVARSVINLQATSVLEANEKIQAMLERNVTVTQDLGDGLGLKNRDVFLIDHQNIKNNEFNVVRQFRVHGHRECIPDLVLFINGLPIVIIECNSPTFGNPMEEGIRQLFCYQEMGNEFKNLGCPLLFQTVQIVAFTRKYKTMYATNFTPQRHWSEWNDPYPLTIDDVARKLGRIPSSLDIFLFGVCSKENLLDLIKNFMVYDREGGRVVKKLAKYQQFRAANKVVKNVNEGRRGGLIWHWQGSGTSLTMLWTAVKLRGVIPNPTMVIVTDRTDLDAQIRGAFEGGGFPNPIKAGSADDLKELLKTPVGQTVTTTFQKFQDAADQYEVLSRDENVFVLMDDVHRSWYRSLALKMLRALPNAILLGFTGTPISKKDEEIYLAFGDTIDQYDHNQSINDGLTVPIYYESRMPNLHISGNPIDQMLRRIFSDKADDELELIEKKYTNLDSIAVSRPLIRKIALDIVNHYENFIMPNGFKALVVTENRLAAVRYKHELDELGAPSNEVLITVGRGDDYIYRPFSRSKGEEAELIERFKNKESDPKILIVCDKLLAGFDAIAVQVIYLHKPLKDHSLLQAVGRVNRKAPKKGYGLVVDYWGVDADIRAAMRMYSEEGIEGLVHSDYKNEILDRLKAAHRKAMDFFEEVVVQADDVSCKEACIRYIESEDRRVAFDRRFGLFSRYMDVLLPGPEALRYGWDLRWLGEIRHRASVLYHDDRLSLSDCGEKVKALVLEAIQESGKSKVILQNIVNELKYQDRRALKEGVDPEVAPFHELMLRKSDIDKEAMEQVSREVYDIINKLAVVDWQKKEDNKREMRRQVKRILRGANIPQKKIQELTPEILEIAARKWG